MKMNTGNCRFLISGHKYKQLWSVIGANGVQEAINVKLLRILIEHPLKLDRNVSNFCAKAKNELSVLTRMIENLDSQKKSTT